MTKELVSLSDWIHFLSTLINVSNTIIFGAISIVILITVSIYLFVDWAKPIILVVIFILIFFIYWFMFGRKSPYTKARDFLKEIMCGKKNDPKIIQMEWYEGSGDMIKNKNIFDYKVQCVLLLLLGIVIGILLAFLYNSDIFSTVSLSVFFPQFFGSFLGFLSAIFIYWLSKRHTKNKEEERKKEMKKNLLLMIKDEINFNLGKVDQIKKEILKNLFPTYRLKTNNKDACWARIIEYRHQDHDLIKNISLLYYKYDILSRTIDLAFQSFHSKTSIPGVEAEIKRLCKKIEEKSEEIRDKIGSGLS